MAIDVKSWDERIIKDLEYRINNFDRKWTANRDTIRNAERGQLNGNLVQEFVNAIQARLIVRNPTIKVRSDHPDYSGHATDLEVTANAITRIIDLRHHLMSATVTSTWSCTGWIEVGHTLDQHNFDPMRSVLYRSDNTADFGETEDRWEPATEAEVAADLGPDIANVEHFDPFQPPPELETASEEAPPPPFDPELGMPWLKEVSPFMVVVPKDTYKIADAEYITKLVLLSKQELKLITNINVKDVSLRTKWKKITDMVPGADFIEEPVLIAVTHIRRDRNNPQYANWYLVHLLGYHDVVIKSAPNPFGGLIPLVPIKTHKSRKIWDTTIVQDLQPYADWYSVGIESIGDRLYESLNQKLVVGAGASLDPEEVKKLLNPKYRGEVKAQGDPSQIKPYDGSGLNFEVVRFLELFNKLAQGASSMSDLDRGIPAKRITARQTEALLESTSLHTNAMRQLIGRAAREIVIKIMHLVGIFSLYRSRRFTFGTQVATLEPGVNDFTTSYSYNIDVRDMAPPAGTEEQLVMVQFLRLLMMDPTPERLLVRQWNWRELSEMIRIRFDMPPETLQEQDLQQLMPQGAPQGAQQGGQTGEEAMGGLEHPERFAGDQGVPDLANLTAGVRQQS